MNTITAVNPPLLFMLNVRCPPSMNCACVVLNVSMPPPSGPPVGLKVGLLTLLPKFMPVHTFMARWRTLLGTRSLTAIDSEPAAQVQLPSPTAPAGDTELTGHAAHVPRYS